MILKLCMQHRPIELYKVYINGEPGLTLTYFMARSNLVPCVFKSINWNFFYKIIKWDKLVAN